MKLDRYDETWWEDTWMNTVFRAFRMKTKKMTEPRWNSFYLASEDYLLFRKCSIRATSRTHVHVSVVSVCSLSLSLPLSFAGPLFFSARSLRGGISCDTVHERTRAFRGYNFYGVLLEIKASAELAVATYISRFIKLTTYVPTCGRSSEWRRMGLIR